MNLKQCLISTLAAATLLGATVAGAYQTEQYGSRSFRTVSVPMDGSVKGRVVTADSSVVSDQPASAIISAAAGGENVTAAINGMFFNSYYKPAQGISFPDNCPLILTNLVQDGQAIAGNGKANSIGFTRDGKAVIDVVNMAPSAHVDGSQDGVGFWSVNQKNENSNASILITDSVTLPYPIQPGSVAFLVENGTVTQELRSGSVTLAKGQSLMVFNPGSYAQHAGWSLLPHVGSSIRYETTLTSSRGQDWSDMVSVAGGGRMLVHNGVVVSADPSYNSVLDGDPKQNATSVLQRSFAAVMNNGTLLLGTGTGSFNEIAQFLQAKGATDAVSLDGGASSMLYENGSFVTVPGRELASVLVFTAPKPEPAPVALPAACKAVIDGQDVTLDAYNIGGNNYVKLRDFAYAMSRYTDSGKAFDVTWNNEYRAVELTSGHPYTVAGGEMTLSQGQSPVTPILSKSPVYKDGASVSLKAYNINNTNYFKLRDMCQTFDIGIQWNNGLRLVEITSADGYAE